MNRRKKRGTRSIQNGVPSEEWFVKGRKFWDPNRDVKANDRVH